MDENKNMIPENNQKQSKVEKTEKAHKPKKLRNQALFKRGGYSLAITAIVIAAVIILNVIVSVLSQRVNLEFDFSVEKSNSMSQKNIDYIESIEDEITITFCAGEKDYYGGVMAYYAQQYDVTDQDANDYYKQTVNLVKKYPQYNKKIKVSFVDTQSSEFNAITSEYPNDTINYGDIIVSCTRNENERYRILRYTDIYELYEDTTYEIYGFTTFNVTGNNIETALTSAISYAASSETKKIAILTGHSAKDYTTEYQIMLKNNNYEVEIIADNLINSISSEYDAIVIAAPTVDFAGTELDAISKFLDNGGKLNKGLIFFADASCPYLTNLYDFLSEWGIAIEDGVLFETEDSNHIPDNPMALGSYPSNTDEKLTADMIYCISDRNVPIKPAFEEKDGITVKEMFSSLNTVVAAPVGTAADWSGHGDYNADKYATVIQSQKLDYDEQNNPYSSYIIAFSSYDFLYSNYSEYDSVANKEISIAAAERAANMENSAIRFISKVITNESFANEITQTSSNLVKIVFMALLPLATIIAGTYIFIKRRNA